VAIVTILLSILNKVIVVVVVVVVVVVEFVVYTWGNVGWFGALNEITLVI